MEKSDIENLIQMMRFYRIDHVKIENQDQEIEITLDIDKIDSTKDKLSNIYSSLQQINKKTLNDNPIDKKEEFIIKSKYVGVYIEPEKEIIIDMQIKKGQTLGYIEMGNIKKTIKAPANGILKEIFVEHNEIIEYGQSLFKIEPLKE